MAWRIAALLFLTLAIPAYSQALSPAISFQGALRSGGEPSAGPVDLRFRLYDRSSGGTQLGPQLTRASTALYRGQFTVELDFGEEYFAGAERWLEVDVRSPPGAGSFVTLSPRLRISAAPYALFALAGNEGPAGPQGPQGDPGIPWSLSGTSAYYAGGNVGIATTSPQAPLHVDGILRIGGVMTGVGGVDGDYLTIQPNSPGLATIRFDQGKLRFVSSNFGEIMRLTKDGRVGVGKTTPSAKVDVVATDGGAILGKSETLYGLQGWSTADGFVGRGVMGVASGANNSIGVYGSCNSAAGYDFFAQGAGRDYGSSSSIRWKRNLEPIDDPLGKIARLRGLYFDWDAEHGGHHDVGMIAEEVGEVLPEIVTYEENGVDAHGMDYSKLTPLLVEAVKALRAETKAEICSLRAENEALRARLESLEARIAEQQPR